MRAVLLGRELGAQRTLPGLAGPRTLATASTLAIFLARTRRIPVELVVDAGTVTATPDALAAHWARREGKAPRYV